MNCEQAREICNKAQYKEANFIDKLRLKFHLYYCKYCAKYSEQNTIITKICDEKKKDVSTKKMDELKKEALKTKINEFKN